MLLTDFIKLNLIDPTTIVLFVDKFDQRLDGKNFGSQVRSVWSDSKDIANILHGCKITQIDTSMKSAIILKVILDVSYTFIPDCTKADLIEILWGEIE